MDNTNLPPVNPNLEKGLSKEQLQSRIQQNMTDIGKQREGFSNIQSQYNPATDATIGALRSQQADKLKQLFAYDTNLAQTYFPIQNAPGPSTGNVPMPQNNQAIVDPTIGLRASSQQTQATAGEMADLGTQIAKRKDELAMGQANALDLAKLFITSKQTENSQLMEMLNKLIDVEEKAKDRKADSEKETDSERTRRIGNELQQDAIAGITYSQAMKKYSNEIGPDEVNRIYNSFSKWGPVKATADELYKGYGVNPPPTGIRPSAQDEKQAQADKEMINIVQSLNDYEKLWKDAGLGGRINPTGKVGAKLETTGNLLTQTMGRYIELGGRGLTDKDREFYRKQLPSQSNIIDELSMGRVEGKIAGVKKEILQKSGYMEVVERATGRKGIIRFEEYDPDLYMRTE